jgi:hypothetical protein
MGDQPDARPLHTRRSQHRKMKTHTSTPQAGFKPTVPVFEQSKTVQGCIQKFPDWPPEVRAANGRPATRCICITIL